MGIYLYRLTEHRVICSDGKPANLAVFLTKTQWDGRVYPEVRRYVEGSLRNARRLKREGKLTDRVVVVNDLSGLVRPGTRVYGNRRRWASFLDDVSLGTPQMPVLDDVFVVNTVAGA